MSSLSNHRWVAVKNRPEDSTVFLVKEDEKRISKDAAGDEGVNELFV
jgi:hypothetical protein